MAKAKTTAREENEKRLKELLSQLDKDQLASVLILIQLFSVKSPVVTDIYAEKETGKITEEECHRRVNEICDNLRDFDRAQGVAS